MTDRHCWNQARRTRRQTRGKSEWATRLQRLSFALHTVRLIVDSRCEYDRILAPRRRHAPTLRAFYTRSHGPPWECRPGRSASSSHARVARLPDDAGAPWTAFPRRAWERGILCAIHGKTAVISPTVRDRGEVALGRSVRLARSGEVPTAGLVARPARLATTATQRGCHRDLSPRLTTRAVAWRGLACARRTIEQTK